MNCFALALDTDHACELHLFRTEPERDAFMWNYAFQNNDTDAATVEEYMAECDGDLSEAMAATNDGWHTDDMLAETTIEAATLAALVKAEAVLADEVERRGDADATVYEIKASPALEAVRAVIESHVNVSPERAWADVAQAEGWGTFETGRGWEIERDDEAGKFDSDEAAESFVKARAAEGSEPHKAALAFIAEDEAERKNG